MAFTRMILIAALALALATTHAACAAPRGMQSHYRHVLTAIHALAYVLDKQADLTPEDPEFWDVTMSRVGGLTRTLTELGVLRLNFPELFTAEQSRFVDRVYYLSQQLHGFDGIGRPAPDGGVPHRDLAALGRLCRVIRNAVREELGRLDELER